MVNSTGLATLPETSTSRFPRLRPASSEEHYRLHIAAVEWSLDTPILIESEQDLVSKPSWKDRFEPYEHQIQNLVTFCRRAPVALLADDVGLGKTISAGLILSELMARKKVTRTLVLCPKILLHQWAEELRTKFEIDSIAETGASLHTAIRSNIPVTITTYHSARNYFEQIRKANYDMIILDEAHKLRNLHGTAKPPKLATSVRDALKDRVFKYVVMLTATPIQNRLWDLYSLTDLLCAAKGHPNPLGSPGAFLGRYIADGSTKAIKLNPGRRKEFRQHLSNYIVRTRRSDSRLEFPERSVKLVRSSSEPIERQLIALISEVFRNEHLNGLAQSSLAQALMSSPEALLKQMENMAGNGTIPSSYLSTIRPAVQTHPITGKLKKLTFLLNELQKQRPDDWRVVVFTTRKETQNAITEHLHQSGITYDCIKGGAARANQRALSSFWDDPPQAHVLVSTDSGAEGVNLQIANVLVNYDLPWNPMIVEQRIGRIQRLASQHKFVTILNLVVEGSIEERIVGRLSEKLQLITQSIGDIESVLESAGGGFKDEDGPEAMIRKFVVDSLRGQDVEAAMRKATRSIERGKCRLEEERELVEKNLGKLDNLHRTGPSVPTLKPIVPSINYEQFCKHALSADGVKLTDLTDKLVEIRAPGRPTETITFDEKTASQPVSSEYSVFSQPEPKLYQPGKPAFERLAQSWCEKAECYVLDYGIGSENSLLQTSRTWFSQFEGVTVKQCEIVESDELLSGDLLCRINAAVSHDRYEKLIPVRFGLADIQDMETLPDSEFTAIEREIDTSTLSRLHQDDIELAIGADKDIDKFCSFYQQRLEEELDAAKSNMVSRAVIKDRFTPALTVEAVGLKGRRFTEATIEVYFYVDGQDGYSAKIKAIPAVGYILEEPEVAACQLTNRRLPACCFERCSVSDKLVIRHLLEQSEESGDFALPEYMRTCAVSGKRILASETCTSDVSNITAAKSLFTASSLSGRLGFGEEIANCEFTGDIVLVDELETSQVSGKQYRLDQKTTSCISGKSGHVSEFVVSDCPKGHLLPSEAGKSDLSDRIVAKSLLHASSRPPGRFGTEDEMVICEVSGNKLLVDEVQTCSVSGKVVDNQILNQSAASGRWALPEFIVKCEQSQVNLLPDEIGRCEVTGRQVDKRLLGASEQSGRLALNDRLVICEHTGSRALPDETENCPTVGGKVLSSLLETCLFTGRRALRSEMVQSISSGRWFLHDDELNQRLSNKFGAGPNVRSCAWRGGQMIINEGSRCRLSGLFVSNDLIENGEFKLLRKMLDGDQVSSQSTINTSEIEKWLRKNKPSYKEFCIDRIVSSPQDDLCIVVGRFSGGLLNLQNNQIGFIVRTKPSFALIGNPFTGNIRKGHWEPSGESAQPESSGRCTICNVDLIPGEGVKCSITGQLVHYRSAARSDVSGCDARRDLLIECETTGKLALPHEVEQCSVSGKTVVKAELETCSISGRRVLRSSMTQSVATEKYFFLDEQSEKILQRDGYGHPYIVECAWLDGKMLCSEGNKCRLTELWIASKYLDYFREFSLFRQLLNGKLKDPAVTNARTLQNWQKIEHLLRLPYRIKEAKALISRKNNFTFLAIRVGTGFLDLTTYVLATVLKQNSDGQNYEIVSKPIYGKVKGRQWMPSDPPKT